MDHVLHVASPVLPGHLKNEADLIVPAREGALRVLRAARVLYVSVGDDEAGVVRHVG
ncbi:hypothetical protein [Cryobacterium sp. GrIS_2_6]|uniref:hypothetical protein n=1 Tax=Cryobacterium sp. GrIS_2_6 TaxID=3162785 RepID=UPI002E026FA7|nr:hypothetical protein [Cryobacterium psychrotolerans]